MSAKTVLAIAGAGDLAKYIVDEALKTERIFVVVLSRQRKRWFDERSPDVSLHVTDYSVTSIRSILDETNASALFSLIHSFDPTNYIGTHASMLEACQQSKTCKRFAPSYFGGNIDAFPGYPRVYSTVHRVFHDSLAKGDPGIEWTVINQGWMMDYVTVFEDEGQYGSKTYMKSQQAIWPINMKAWKTVVPGTGDEPAAFTSARDVAKAISALALAKVPWERHTYLVGEQITWNKLLDKLETFYDHKFLRDERRYMSLSEIHHEMNSQENMDNPAYQALLQMQEWTALGGQGLPLDLVQRQREKFFKGITFRKVDNLLEDSKAMSIV